MLQWIMGAVLFGTGVAMNTWIERRRFYRRNQAGLEVFNSFGASLATRGFEGLVLLVGRVAGVCGVAVLALAAMQTFVLKH